MGGLTLAHALGDSAEVVVLDRDPEASATGGYRLHLDAPACRILAAALPRVTWSTIRAVSDDAETFRAFTIADDRLRPVVVDRQPPGEDRLLCNRVPLRQLMADSLGDRVRFGARVARVLPGDSVSHVVLSTGEILEADVVIGAEGSASPTVMALAGASTARPTGLVGIAGSTLLDRDSEVPAFLLQGPGLALSGNGTGMFLSLTGLRTGTPGATADLKGAPPPPSLVWGLIVRRSALPDPLPTSAEDLVGVVLDCLRRWDRRLRSLVARSDLSSVASYTFRAVDPRADLTPWQPGLVTAIGDAVHCMPPTGGRAAATAVRDAGHLATLLRSHPCTPEGARAAIHAYETAMPRWAVPAVRESLGPVAIIRALAHPGLTALATPALHVAGCLGHARHRIAE